MWLKSGYRRRPKDESAPQIFCSNDLTIPAFSSRRSRGCSIPKPAQRPRTAGRPNRPFDYLAESGSNWLVSGPSDTECSERLLSHPANTCSRPSADLHGLGVPTAGYCVEQPYSDGNDLELIGQACLDQWDGLLLPRAASRYQTGCLFYQSIEV